MRIRQYSIASTVSCCDIIVWFCRNCKWLHHKKIHLKKKWKKKTGTKSSGVGLHVQCERRYVYHYWLVHCKYMYIIYTYMYIFFLFNFFSKLWLSFLTSRFCFFQYRFFIIIFYVNKLVRVVFVCSFFRYTCSLRVKLATSWNSNP